MARGQVMRRYPPILWVLVAFNLIMWLCVLPAIFLEVL